MKRITHPLAAWYGLLAAVNTIVASATLGEVVGQKVAGLCVLFVAAAQSGTAAYHATTAVTGRRPKKHSPLKGDRL